MGGTEVTVAKSRGEYKEAQEGVCKEGILGKVSRQHKTGT